MTSPDDLVLRDAARTVGLDAADARRLKHHATAVYLLPSEGIVARIANDDTAIECAERAVVMTRWLTDLGFPATEPADVDQPVRTGGSVVTFWKYYPQGDRSSPPAWRLGGLLRQLHALPRPPIDLPPSQPLARFIVTVEASTSLHDDDRRWLLWRSADLLKAYGELDFPLGIGHLHGDAYPGNMLWDGGRVILGDWDEIATGPRELDLANTYQGTRFGRTTTELAAFAEAYGYDIATWSGLPTLRSMRDLHTLGTYIRLADTGHHEAAEQLAYRIGTLRRCELDAPWSAR